MSMRSVLLAMRGVCVPRCCRCTAGLIIACEVGYYQEPTTLISNNQGVCTKCPPHSTTAREGSSHIKQCVCEAEYYNTNTTGGVTCASCPIGTDCFEAGVELFSLPLSTGYYRPSRDSLDVRRCPDAYNGNNSGCLSGSVEPCRDTLAGPFCALCDRSNATARVYYVKASDSQVAHCEVCRNSTISTLLMAFGAVAFALLLSFLLRRYKPMQREGIKRFMRRFSPQNKLKIMIAFYMIATKVDDTPHLSSHLFPSQPDPSHLIPHHPIPFQPPHHTISSYSTPPRPIPSHPIPSPLIPSCPIPHHPKPSHTIFKVEDVYEIELPQDVRNLLHILSVTVSFGVQGLAATPLACAGLSGYIPRLLFWTNVPLLAACCVPLCIAGVRWWQFGWAACTRAEVIEQSSPALLSLLFILYPIVTKVAFEAFPCHELNGGIGWLITDVAIDCNSDTHLTAKLLAWVAIGMYPIGMWLFMAGILYLVKDVMAEGRETPLSRSISFLHREYEPHAYW